MATSTKTPAKQSASLTGIAAKAARGNRSDRDDHERAADAAMAAQAATQAALAAPVAAVLSIAVTTKTAAATATTVTAAITKAGKAEKAAKVAKTALVKTAQAAQVAPAARAAEIQATQTTKPAKVAQAAKTGEIEPVPQARKENEAKGKGAKDAKDAKATKVTKTTKATKVARAGDVQREAAPLAARRAGTLPATPVPVRATAAPSTQPIQLAHPQSAQPAPPSAQSPRPAASTASAAQPFAQSAQSTQPATREPAATRPDYWERACADLQKRDRILKKLIPKIGPAHLQSRGDPFVTLVRAVIGQQISVAAAQAVWQRVERACPKLAPQQFIRLGHDRLMACGVSKRKTEYLLDLAQHFTSGALHVGKWTSMGDEDVIAELTQIRGIGRWTAEMFLIFNLARPNVLPLDDLGLIRAISVNYFSGEPVTRSEAREVAANWEPWRTVATWYMWRSLEAAQGQ